MKLFNIQQGIYNNIKGIDTPVFDYVPEKTEFPYVVLGEIEEVPENTKTTVGSRITQTLYVFSNAEGKKETFEIINDIKESFSSDLEIHDSFLVSQKFSKVKVQEMELYYQGIVEIEIILDEE